jgi:hypothetical protein
MLSTGRRNTWSSVGSAMAADMGHRLHLRGPVRRSAVRPDVGHLDCSVVCPRRSPVVTGCPVCREDDAFALEAEAMDEQVKRLCVRLARMPRGGSDIRRS